MSTPVYGHTPLVVDVSSEVRDEGHTVWSCHDAQIPMTLSQLQTMLSAFGYGDTLYVKTGEIVSRLANGRAKDLLLHYEAGSNRKVKIRLALAPGWKDAVTN